MTIGRSFRNLCVLGCGALFFSVTGPHLSLASEAGRPQDELYLDGLQGKWVMTGVLAGKPVRYRAEGQRVLGGAFLELHMIDVKSPPRYEADVFLGFDHESKDYIAHWLDGFGASGARVVARGERQDQQLVLTFPYAEGPFRDTLTFRPASKSWSLLLESQSANGTWSTFASYALTRAPIP